MLNARYKFYVFQVHSIFNLAKHILHGQLNILYVPILKKG